MTLRAGLFQRRELLCGVCATPVLEIRQHSRGFAFRLSQPCLECIVESVARSAARFVQSLLEQQRLLRGHDVGMILRAGMVAEGP